MTTHLLGPRDWPQKTTCPACARSNVMGETQGLGLVAMFCADCSQVWVMPDRRDSVRFKVNVFADAGGVPDLAI